MITSRYFLLALLLAGGAAAAFTIGRNTRHLEKRQHKEDLRTWENEGGNPAPMPRPRRVPRQPRESRLDSLK